MCKANPDWTSYSSIATWQVEHISSTKGKIPMTNGATTKWILPDEYDDYISKGWNKGLSDKTRLKIKENATGKAHTAEAEEERKKKISESMKNNPNAGGYRHGSGRGHKGTYNGIYCDSAWELAYLVYCLKNNIKVCRCTERRIYIFENKKHIYIPDFLVNNTIIEIKGYKSKQWDAKFEQNPDVKVLYWDDIKPMYDYCVNEYGKEFWKVLYNKK